MNNGANSLLYRDLHCETPRPRYFVGKFYWVEYLGDDNTVKEADDWA